MTTPLEKFRVGDKVTVHDPLIAAGVVTRLGRKYVTVAPENPAARGRATCRLERRPEVYVLPVMVTHRPAADQVIHPHSIESAATPWIEGLPGARSISHPRRNPRNITDEVDLMRALAAAAEPCFDTADRVAVYCEMNLGSPAHALDELISAVIREDHPMPAGLIDGLKEWLADDPIDDNDDFVHHLAERLALVRTN